MVLRRRLLRLRRDARSVGLSYAALEVLDAASRRAIVAPLERRLIALEVQRGELGPATRRYSGHSVGENRATWGDWHWRADGEDWTFSAEWKQTMLDHLLRPAMGQGGTILEIGPGGGRWSKELALLADELILVDITDQTLELCRARLGDSHGVRYVRNHGNDLPGVAGETVDRIWSFDVFVHIRPVEIASYLDEIARVLRPGGVAVVHHAGASRPLARRDGWRSPMSAALLRNLAAKSGLRVDEELTTWPTTQVPLAFGDVISILASD